MKTDPVLEEPANAEVSEPFLRIRQRVPVRRRGRPTFASRFGWKNRWVRFAIAGVAFAILSLLVALVLGMKSLLLRNPRFLLTSINNIQVSGNRVVTTPQVLSVFAPDVGHSIFHLPLDRRQTELQKIQGVRRAAVIRLWPDRIHVNVVERTPIAFARDGNAVRLIDDDGVLLDLPEAAAQHYSFPVINGVSSVEPLAARAARMNLYRQFVSGLNAEGGNIAASLSEVDLSDTEDVRAMFSGGHQPMVHFGDSNFLARYQAYRDHLKEWQQQYPNLQSVDMRYGKQVVLDTGSVPQQAMPQKLTDVAPPLPVPVASDTAQPAKMQPAEAVATPNTAKAKSSAKLTAKHHAAVHKTTHKHRPPAPERGHPVLNPIMHTVKGA